jgi:uncharacterized membrane protein
MGDRKGRSRITGIDALRGVAVLCMLTQHVVFWLSAERHNSPAMMLAGAVGGLAAPLFIVLAGLGATLTVTGNKNGNFLMVRRGLVILGFGYLLNLLAPNWFAPGSWYVLHMIGFGIFSVPLIAWASDRTLIAVIFMVITATACLQSYLDTPLVLNNALMVNTSLTGGIFRLALLEGFFPIFPWIAFFIAGMLAGRRIIDRSHGSILRTGLVFLELSVLVSGVYYTDLFTTLGDPAVRFFKPVPSFYPAFAPISLFLISVALIFVTTFMALNRAVAITSDNVLVCLGRSSMTILLVHIIVVRESAVRLGFWRSFSIEETALITALIVIFFAAAARLWRKVDYRFGAEWTLRAISGKTS